nr:PREDICTED: flap endonuclease 1-like isoform X2 [Musa acuminata subsp. malaccensis]
MGIKVRVLFFLCPCSCLLASSPRDGVPRLLLFTCWTKLLADNAPKAMKDQKFESCFGRKIAVSATFCFCHASYVFDGQPPELKKQELAKRYSKREDATEDLNAAIEAGDTGN